MNKYAQAFAQAMDATGTRNTAVASHAGVLENNVSQWRTGRRPIPAERAVAVSALLGVPPERISEAYERLLLAGYSAPAMPVQNLREDAVPAGHVAIERLEDFGRPEGPAHILLPEFLSHRKIGLTPMEHVRWTLHPSRAMEPEIDRHALVLVDITACSHEHVVDGGIYAYTLWGRPDIRRVLIRKNSWSVACYGKDADSTDVPDSDLGNLHIFGAVIGSL